LTVSVDGSGSLNAVSWSWKFGDGATGGGVTSSHTYADPGLYTITLTVTNATGQIDSDSKSVVITAALVETP
jgi:PKD repeat protein